MFCAAWSWSTLAARTIIAVKDSLWLIDWLIVWCVTPFSKVFQLYCRSQCTYPCFPGVLLTSTPHNILSKPLAAFPHNHCPNNRQQWAGEWILLQGLSSIFRENNGQAGYWSSDLLFSNPPHYRLSYGARRLFMELTVTMVLSFDHFAERELLTLYHTIWTFNYPKKAAFWKHCGKRKKMLVTSIFFFLHVFYLSQNKFQFFSHIYFIFCKCFQFGPLLKFVIW